MPRSIKPAPLARRDPIGLQRLLEVYDDYPLVIEERDAAQTAVVRYEEETHEAQRRRNEIQATLDTERIERKAEVEAAIVSKAAAEKAVEERVRTELNKKIKALEVEMRGVKEERDALKKERAGWRGKMEDMLEVRDRLDRERKTAREKEVAREKEREELDGKMREVVKGILDMLPKGGPALKSVTGTGTGMGTGTTSTATSVRKA